MVLDFGVHADALQILHHPSALHCHNAIYADYIDKPLFLYSTMRPSKLSEKDYWDTYYNCVRPPPHGSGRVFVELDFYPELYLRHGFQRGDRSFYLAKHSFDHRIIQSEAVPEKILQRMRFYFRRSNNPR
jgi:hypothetical protein